MQLEAIEDSHLLRRLRLPATLRVMNDCCATALFSMNQVLAKVSAKAVGLQSPRGQGDH